MQLCRTVYGHLYRKVIANLHIHLEEVLKQNGGHLTQTVH